MSPLQILAVQPGVYRLGSTLLHFLWEGSIIAAAYAVARIRVRASAPDVRYLLACAALATMAAAPLATWSLIGPSAGAEAGGSAATSVATFSTAVRSVPVMLTVGDSGRAMAPLLSLVVAVWFAGAMALWLRLAGGFILAARLRTRWVRAAPPIWQEALERLKARMRVSAPVRMAISSMAPAPAVVGWLRPVVLFPAAALAGLPAAEMEALLLHELAHIRRHDYLVNLLQSAVEALLFYHPAVWWISGQMRLERELCCDDAVIAASGDAVAYARALAEMGSLRPRLVVAANGGFLAHRVGRLLGRPRPAPNDLSGTGMALGGVLAVMAVAVFGQSAPHPRFEVASIKDVGSQGFMTLRPLPGRLTATASLKLLIERAYRAQSFEIAGGPEWIESERYAIDAKTAGTSSPDQIALMLQALLEDRFQLKIHRETRDLPVFHLAAAKGGPKLPLPKDGGCDDSGEPLPEVTGGRMPVPRVGPIPLQRCGSLSVILEAGGPRMFGGRVAMPELVRMLSLVLGRTVIDQTGFTGLFDVRLDFVADESTPALPPPPPGAGSDAMNPPIFSALAQQLGLRLQAAKGPVEVIVIDHVERPSAN